MNINRSLGVNHVCHLFNSLSSCRFSHYWVCKIFPKGFALKFHSDTIDHTMQAQLNSTSRKCSTKLMNSFEQHYKHKLSYLKLEEQKIVQSLKLFHPEQANYVMAQLQQRTWRMKEMYEVLHLNTYVRDGLRPRIANVVARNDYRMSDLIKESRLISPIRQLNKL